MPLNDNAEFNSYASNYDKMLEKGMILPGSDHAYFEQYKLFYLRPYLKQCHKLLDYGCGIGCLSQAIQDVYPNMVIHGYDISKDSIANVSPTLLHDHNRFVSNRDDLDADYDVVLLITMLHHVTLDERSDVMLDAAHRVKPGGVLIIIEHNMLNFLTKRSVDACPMDKDAVMLSVKESKQLTSLVFPKVESRYIIFWPKQLRFMRFTDVLLRKIPLGAQYMVVCRKEA